jgi:hypothetical protein
MPYLVPKNIAVPKPPAMQYWPSSPSLLNGGINLTEREWKLSDNQTPNVKNMWWKDGELSKRFGQEYVIDSIAVETPNYATYKKLYEGHIIKHCGTKMYKQDPITETTTEIYTGLTAIKGSFFKFGDKLYYMQAGKFLQYDGTTVSEVVPYIPTVIINRTPTGGGDVLENYNRIGKGFINKFNGNASAVAYTLTDANLDATTVTCTVDGVAKVENTDFTVNRTTGIVTFVSAPATGTNNVAITAYKTVQADIDTILKCKYAIPFGGQNDNRIFIGGNGTGYFYWTGISANGIDATYFAYNNYNVIGNSDEDITGFGKHYDTLTIHKESGEIYGETYDWDGIKGIFSTFPINQQYGCDCPETLQNINNNLVWLNSRYGVCILVGTTVGSQRNAFPISRNIDPRLMKEIDLKMASSVDFNGHYWLCVNDKVYLWNYFISPYYSTGNPDADAQRLSWWYFDNINAQSFVIDGQDLYHANRTTGQFVKFHTAYDAGQFYDFGEGISAVYRYPIREMGNGVYEFWVPRGWVNVRGDTKTSFIVTYFTSDEPDGDPSTEVIEVGSFMWNNFNWSLFTWGVMGPVYQWALAPGAKNIRYFGAEFANAEAGRDMNISSIIFQYSIKKMIK